MNEPQRPTWIEVNRAALVNNVRQLRRLIGERCQLAAVVKANAYGHGVLPVAETVLSAGADRLAVATLGEAIELRDAGIEAPILVLGYTPPHHAEDAVRRNVTVTVFDLETARRLAEAGRDLGKRAAVHVKVNTGMNRLGLRPNAVAGFLREAQGMPHLAVEGVFTHFATSDTDRAFASVQFERFRTLLSSLEAKGLRPKITHAANSAAVLTMPETHLDMVRCGIALYGLDPDEEHTPLPSQFMPALSWKAQVAQVTRLEPGEGVSYGLEFVAQRPAVVAVIPVGYADGFPRRPLTWGSVLVHGRLAPIAGRVCMDQTVLDVTALEESGLKVRQGDEVVLIGRQGDAVLTAEEAARRTGTINYDVVSRILPRVPRVLVGGET